MNEQDLIIGIDLGNGSCQLSFFNTDKMEPESCDDFSIESSNSPLQLIDQVIRNRFGEEVSEKKIYMTLTYHDIPEELLEEISHFKERSGLQIVSFDIIEHDLACEYHIVSMEGNISARDVGVFEFGNDYVYYQHYSVSDQNIQCISAERSVDLSSFFTGISIGSADPESVDKAFVKAIDHAVSGKNISSFFIVGDEGFLENGPVILKRSLQKLCAMKRRVFIGNNLYVSGACYYSCYRAGLLDRPDMVLLTGEKSAYEVYMMTLQGRKAHKTVLLPAGNMWDSSDCTVDIIIGDVDHIVVRLRDLITGEEKRACIVFDGLPERPSKMTRIRLETGKTKTGYRVHAADLGFGELCRSSGMTWDLLIDPDGSSPETDAAEEGFIIQVDIPSEGLYAVMPVTGIRIYTIEELCRYIADYLDVIGDDFFDMKLYSFIDAVSRNTSLSAYIRGDSRSSLRDRIKRLMLSVDYFNQTEINSILQGLQALQRLPVFQRIKKSADMCLKSGRYLSALKQYHHLTVSGDVDRESISPEYLADIYHGMGIASLRLHCPLQALDCMEKAADCSGAEKDVKNYVYMLSICGHKVPYKGIDLKYHITADMVKQWQEEAEKVSENYLSSDRGMKLREKLDLKINRRMSDYSDFVNAFVNSEREKYRVL